MVMQSYEMELAVVVGMMLDNSKIMEVDLLPEEFAYELPRNIYTAILDLTSKRMAADVITVAEWMEATNPVVGDSWFSQICRFAENVTPVNVAKYAERVRSMAIQRKAAQIGQILVDTAHEGQDAVNEAIRSLMDLGRTRRKWDYTISEAMRLLTDDMEAALDGKASGVLSGIEDVDKILGRFHDTDLIIVGARPAMGKTAFLLNCLLGSASAGGLISAEQGVIQIASRLVAIDGLVNAQNLRRVPKLRDDEWARISGAVGRLDAASIFINDMPAPTIQDIQRQARKWKYQNNIKALYVDYIQRIKGDPRLARHEQVGNTAMALKELARELMIPVIALAQVNREVEKRADKRPMMGDLKDSGTIEQEADVIMTLYRDEEYNQETHEKGIMEIGIEKNRHGVTGRIKTVWRGEFLRVEPLARY